MVAGQEEKSTVVYILGCGFGASFDGLLWVGTKC